jgi:hypothetical protein
MRLGHPSHSHPDHVGSYIERMRIECISMVAAETFDVVEEGETR